MNEEDMAEALKVPELKVHFSNTQTREKEQFEPLSGKLVRIYTCGPTVYNFAHIGNFRTYVFEDILRRTLKFFSYEVQQVMNITDIDDKTIRGAIEKKIPLDEFTEPFTKAFFEDLATLNIERAEYYPRATAYIEQMIDFIQKLLDQGSAYVSKDKSIYFALDKFPKYGSLSHLKLDGLCVGERVCMDEYDKENVGDFVLWKSYDPKRDGHVYWESPFGPGRPGWHLECSTMAMTLLGDTLDIHVGAVDNIFPHHENEIAQSESLSHKPFARLWMHSEHLLVNHKKMSKSLGNFYTLRDLLDKGYTGLEVRYMLMHTHYRTQLNFTMEGMEGAKKALHHLQTFMKRMQVHSDARKPFTQISREVLKKTMRGFAEAMADDLNISQALSFIFELTHSINSLYDRGLLSPGDAHEVLFLLFEINRILGVLPQELDETGPPHEVLALFDQRNQARRDKNFALADSLRGEISRLGYIIEDTPYGSKVKKKT